MEVPTDEACKTTIKVLKYLTRKQENHHEYKKINKTKFREIQAQARLLTTPYFQKQDQKKKQKLQWKNLVREKSGIEESQRQKDMKYSLLYQTQTKTLTVEPDDIKDLNLQHRCYICKKKFTQTINSFYDQLCNQCTEFNLQKRNQTLDLSGKIAVVTGCRVKIGFEICLKLLRAGCRVIGTTRFPQDAIKRYKAESDFQDWIQRLEIYAIDFRYLALLENFCSYIKSKYPKIDYLINNAAQTIDRTDHFAEFYKEPLSQEITKEATMNVNYLFHNSDQKAITLEFDKQKQITECKYDADHQPVLELKENKTSWQLKLPEVGTRELIETQCINYFASFILIRELTPALRRTESGSPYSYIINVSAMEGRFDRQKTAEHPHTNAAKAALNMLTRTCGLEYKTKHNIVVASCDTGWITNYDDFSGTWKCPIDAIDGAARVLDLIFIQSGDSGYFWKDYKICTW